MLPSIAPSLRAHILNILLLNASDSSSIPSESTPDEDPYVLRSTTSKGGSTSVGAFATCALERGEPILTEHPLCIWPQELGREEADVLFGQMNARAQETLMSLANVAPNELGEVLGRRATNGFNVELPEVDEEWAGRYEDEDENEGEAGEGDHGAETEQTDRMGEKRPTHAGFIFPRIARINHSCLNNADHAIDWSNLLMTVYATTPIAEGEEITIEYTSALIQRTRDERQAILRELFNFSCACECCSLEGDALAASDSRRRKVDEIVRGIASGEWQRSEVLEGFSKMREIIEEEGYVGMPEFSEPGVTGAYRMWVQMAKRRE